MKSLYTCLKTVKIEDIKTEKLHTSRLEPIVNAENQTMTVLKAGIDNKPKAKYDPVMRAAEYSYNLMKKSDEINI